MARTKQTTKEDLEPKDPILGESEQLDETNTELEEQTTPDGQGEETPTDETMADEALADAGEESSEEVEALKELGDAAKDLEESKEELDTALNENPEQAEQLIKDEIEEVKQIQNNIKKTARKLSNAQVSNYWNGMTQDW